MGMRKINTSYFGLDWPHIKRIWAEDEVKRYDTIWGSRKIFEWNSLDAFEKLREENSKELNKEAKEVCNKVKGWIKITKENEDKDDPHSARKDEDDTGTAHG